MYSYNFVTIEGSIFHAEHYCCPGCQGVIETLFKEGKWKHKCSVCKDTPFTCPVSHPIKA